MITVYKYTLQPISVTTINLPINAEVLTVSFQEENLCMWIMVNTGIEHTTERTFGVFGTGHDIPQAAGQLYDFIGTALMGNGLVWHVFEVE